LVFFLIYSLDISFIAPHNLGHPISHETKRDKKERQRRERERRERERDRKENGTKEREESEKRDRIREKRRRKRERQRQRRKLERQENQELEQRAKEKQPNQGVREGKANPERDPRVATNRERNQKEERRGPGTKEAPIPIRSSEGNEAEDCIYLARMEDHPFFAVNLPVDSSCPQFLRIYQRRLKHLYEKGQLLPFSLEHKRLCVMSKPPSSIFDPDPDFLAVTEKIGEHIKNPVELVPKRARKPRSRKAPPPIPFPSLACVGELEKTCKNEGLVPRGKHMKNLFSKKELLEWPPEKKEAWEKRHSDPNLFFEFFTEPMFYCSESDWTAEEKQVFHFSTTFLFFLAASLYR